MQKQKSTKLTERIVMFFVLTIVFGFLFFVNTAPVTAAENTPTNNQPGRCLFGFNETDSWVLFNITKADCDKKCLESDPEKKKDCLWKPDTNVLHDLISPTSNIEVIRDKAPSDTCDMGQWSEHPINCALLSTLQFVGTLVTVGATLFAWIADVNVLMRVIDSAAIYSTWQLVRDLLNIVFILVLLFSAFSTIFQVEKYNYKKILLALIIAALLVNFSFPIARFIIDASNTLMYTIINNLLPNKGTTLSALTDNSGIQGILRPPISAPTSYLLSAIVFTFILAITLIAVGILLVVRMIALAILIIFSPIAFVGSILPGAEKYASEWWDKLFKYSFFGPIMLLMIYIATKMTTMMAQQEANGIFAAAKQNSNDSTLVGAIAYFSIPIIILWIGIGIAQGMSITGASAVMGQAQKFMGWAGKTFSGYRAGKWFATKAVPRMGKAGLETFEEGFLAKRGLSPTAFVEGWKQRSKKKREDVINPAIGAWHDRLNRLKSLGNEKTRYKDTAVQTSILKKQKELADVSQSSEYLYNEYEAAEKVGDTDKMAAVLRIMFSNNDQNEFMKIQGKVVDPFTLRDEIYKRFTDLGMSSNDAAKQLSDLSEIAVSKGNYANYGMAMFDADKKSATFGQYVKATDDEKPDKNGKKWTANEKQTAAAVAKTTNIKLQTKADLWHWNSLFQENPNGTPGNLHDAGKGLLNDLKMLDMEGLKRLRNDFIKKAGAPESLRQIREHAKTLDTTQQKIVEKFADEIEKLRIGKAQAQDTQSFTDGAGI